MPDLLYKAHAAALDVQKAGNYEQLQTGLLRIRGIDYPGVAYVGKANGRIGEIGCYLLGQLPAVFKNERGPRYCFTRTDSHYEWYVSKCTGGERPWFIVNAHTGCGAIDELERTPYKRERITWTPFKQEPPPCVLSPSASNPEASKP